MYQLSIYLINLKCGPKKILGIIVGYDEYAAIEHALSIYKDSEFVDLGKVISWQEFKSYFNTENWPEEYLDNELGLFDIEDLLDAATFLRGLISEVLDKKYDLKIEMSAN